jgi:hypothetical protein
MLAAMMHGPRVGAREVTPGIYNRGGYAGQPVRGAQHRQGLRSDDRELGAAST